MTDRLAHHSFSLKRQQIIKPCRAQLDRAAFNAIGTVFNTFWPQLATGFFGFMSDRPVIPGDLSDWNRSRAFRLESPPLWRRLRTAAPDYRA
ncbi:MAG: hypothetical protein EOS26_24220 [Mesorhizobium sp.]|nr:MAG: hypothetical protein EOS26_24220 [Mesorhizobium sp.]